MSGKVLNGKDIKLVLNVLLCMILLTCVTVVTIFWELYIAGAITMPVILGIALTGFTAYTIAGALVLAIIMCAVYLLSLLYRKIITNLG